MTVNVMTANIITNINDITIYINNMYIDYLKKKFYNLA